MHIVVHDNIGKIHDGAQKLSKSIQVSKAKQT